MKPNTEEIYSRLDVERRLDEIERFKESLLDIVEMLAELQELGAAADRLVSKFRALVDGFQWR